MTSRERVSRVLSGQVPDRVPMSDGYWSVTVERWRSEGLPADVSPNSYFGTDEIASVRGDYSMQFPEETVREDAGGRTYWDLNGALRRDRLTPSGKTSVWEDFRIKTRDDWHRHRDRLRFNPSRIRPEVKIHGEKAGKAGRFLCFSAHGPFHTTWMKIGMEREFVWMLEEPELIQDIFSAHTQLVLDVFDGMLREGIVFDGVRIADDLGYQVSPIISPGLYKTAVFPHHQRMCRHFANAGLATILHSDGNVGPLIPDFISAGFRVLNPLEVKAGLDVEDLKNRYGGKLGLFGNIDVRKLAGSREDIEEEISRKLPIAKEGGGYIYHSDHSVPNDVSLDNYRFAMELVERYGRYD